MVTSKHLLRFLTLALAGVAGVGVLATSAAAQSAPNLAFVLLHNTGGTGTVYTVGIELNNSGQYPQTVDTSLHYGGAVIDSGQVGYTPKYLTWFFDNDAGASLPGTYEVCLDSDADETWSAGHLCETFVFGCHPSSAVQCGPNRFLRLGHPRVKRGRVRLPVSVAPSLENQSARVRLRYLRPTLFQPGL